MTDKTAQAATPSAETGNSPTHRVTFRRRLKSGYGTPVELGGGWQNAKGGISFPFAGGSITVWPNGGRNEKAGA